MEFNTTRASLTIGKILVFIFAGLLLTMLITAVLLYTTTENRKRMNPIPVIADIVKQPDSPYMEVEKPAIQIDTPGSLAGFLPPASPDVPAPPLSKKSNTVMENLLFAMKFYGGVPDADATTSSVIGWDLETGYHLVDTGTPSSPYMALARNIRYLLVLNLYVESFPNTKYFDDDLTRIDEIVDQLITSENLNQLITPNSFLEIQVPDTIFHDLLWLSDLTGEQKYKDAALLFGEKHAVLVMNQASIIKNNRDRTDRVHMFNMAALGYITGKMLGNIDLMRDSEVIVEELVDQLWSDQYNLIYTDVAFGILNNITNTFITGDQMHALVGMLRFAEVTGNPQLIEIARTMLKSLQDGSNPLCDSSRLGFYRRYNGDSRLPQKDFKVADDHVTYLEAWIKLNKVTDGEFDKVLDYEIENYENLLYDSYYNCFYLSYELDFRPYNVANNRPLASVDVILSYILMTLEDRKFRAEKHLG